MTRRAELNATPFDVYPFQVLHSRFPVTSCCPVNSGQRSWHSSYKSGIPKGIIKNIVLTCNIPMINIIWLFAIAIKRIRSVVYLEFLKSEILVKCYSPRWLTIDTDPTRLTDQYAPGAALTAVLRWRVKCPFSTCILWTSQLICRFLVFLSILYYIFTCCSAPYAKIIFWYLQAYRANINSSKRTLVTFSVWRLAN